MGRCLMLIHVGAWQAAGGRWQVVAASCAPAARDGSKYVLYFFGDGQSSVWSRGMIPPLGGGGREFESRNGPQIKRSFFAQFSYCFLWTPRVPMHFGHVILLLLIQAITFHAQSAWEPVASLVALLLLRFALARTTASAPCRSTHVRIYTTIFVKNK